MRILNAPSLIRIDLHQSADQEWPVLSDVVLRDASYVSGVSPQPKTS
jgi:hypothetical protein